MQTRNRHCTTCKLHDPCINARPNGHCRHYEPKPKPWYVRLVEAIRAWAEEGR